MDGSQLLTIILGSSLASAIVTFIFNWLKEHIEKSKNQKLSLVFLVNEFEHYAFKCFDIIQKIEQKTAPAGCFSENILNGIRANAPNMALEKQNINWANLDKNNCDKILRFPLTIKIIQDSIDGPWTDNLDPEETIDLMGGAVGFAGIKALEISDEIAAKIKINTAMREVKHIRDTLSTWSKEYTSRVRQEY